MQIEAPAACPGPLRLRAPEVLQAVGARAVCTAVPLPPERQAAVESEAGRFLAALLAQELPGGGFAACLDGAFALGRAQVRLAAGLVEAGILQRKFADMEAMPVFRAIAALRSTLAGLQAAAATPARRWRDLLPWPPRGAAAPAESLPAGLHALQLAGEATRAELAELEATRAALWEAMQKLAAAIHFAQVLDERLRIRVDVLRASEPRRAAALEQDVLRQVRQNLREMLAQQVLCTNCYLAIEVLKQTGREVLAGADAVAALVAAVPAGAGEPGRPARLEQALQAIDAMVAFRAQAAQAMARNADTLQALAAAPATVH